MITFQTIKKLIQEAADLSDTDGLIRYVNGHTACIQKTQPNSAVSHWRIEPDYKVSAHSGINSKNYEYEYFK
jgi:hypothetical protein